MSHRLVGITRRRFLGATAAMGAATVLDPVRRTASAQGAKPTISFWNGLTGADGKVMGELIGRFTKETGIQVELQMIVWPDLYAKLQVSTPAGEGPDACLIHTTEVPHFSADGILNEMDDRTLASKGFRAEDYLPSPWNGGAYRGKRYTIPLDVPQHILFMNMQLMKEAGFGEVDSVILPSPRDKIGCVSSKRSTRKGIAGVAAAPVSPNLIAAMLRSSGLWE